MTNPLDEVPIPKSYAVETCKMGQLADCCRYLAADKNGFCCLKGSELKALLDARVAKGEMNARADNCPGWAIVGRDTGGPPRG